MSDATVFVSMAFAIVWMKRHNRWDRFFGALEGKYKLPTSAQANAATAASDAAGTGTTNTDPTANPVNQGGPIDVGGPVKAQ